MYHGKKHTFYENIESSNRYYFDRCEEAGIPQDVIVGNHDCPYTSTNRSNGPEVILQGYERVSVWSSPKYLELDGVTFLLLPWINKSNAEESLAAIKAGKADIVCGHLALNGFEMRPGKACEKGINPALFSKYKQVWSGHFHSKHSKGNIHYLGAPYQMRWDDYGVRKGFHIFDTETMQLEFVENPYTLYEKIYYDDTEFDSLTDLKKRLPETDGKFVKLVVEKKTHVDWFEQLRLEIEDAEPLKIDTIEDTRVEVELSEMSVEDLQRTDSLIESYVDAYEADVDKDRLKNILVSCYVEATENV